MTRTGVLEGVPADEAAVKAAELQKELQKLAEAIVGEDGVNLDAIEAAYEMSRTLRELNWKNNLHQMYSNNTVPEDLKCPLSKELMIDPVVIVSGQTYDRTSVQRWLKCRDWACPETEQILSQTILAPNLLIRERIIKWCSDNGIELALSAKDRFLSLIGKMSSSTLSVQMEAAKDLRLLTNDKNKPTFRTLFIETPDAIPQFLSPLSQSNVHPELHEHIITTIFNICLDSTNKKLLAALPVFIPLLHDALKCGRVETKKNAAATLSAPGSPDSNKEMIGKSGVLETLIKLLHEDEDLGHSTTKQVIAAIGYLCNNHDNKVRAITKCNVVRLAFEKISSGVYCSLCLELLDVLSKNQKCIEKLGELEAVACLFSLIKKEDCPDHDKEVCMSILHSICCGDTSKWSAMREEEAMYQTLSEIAEKGNSKAKGILERLN